MRLQHTASIVISLLTLFYFAPASTLSAQVFVDQNAGGANDGSSWANAYQDLQTALALTAGGQIWVAEGTYRPVSCNPCTDAQRQIAFQIPPDVQLYGGFSGTENSLTERDPQTNQTILSGDIGVVNDSLDNVYNVLIAVNSTENNVLDGFIIEDGNADGSFGFSAGGGLLLDANPAGTADMQIRNCTFRNNYAGGGGAIAIDCVLGGVSRAEIRNCVFEGNTASLGVVSTGAAIFMQGNSGAQVMPRMISCIFRNNYSGNDGGAISATPTGQGTLLSMQVDSCLFTGNRADDRGAGIWYRMSSFGECRVSIKNSRFEHNQAGGEGGAIYARSSFENIANDTIANCLFTQNRADGSSSINDGEGGAIFIRGSQLGIRNQLIANCVFDRNHAAHLGGGVATSSIVAAPGTCQVNMVNCSFYGNTTDGEGGAIHTQDSTGTNSLSVFNSIFWADTAAVAGSELFNDRASVTLAHCNIAGGLPVGIIDGGDLLEVDPMYSDPERGDLHLPSCSPLIDRGDNTALLNTLPYDLDGDPRIHAGTVDLGAYEIGIVYVDEDATGSNNGRSWTNAFKRFEDGLAAASAGDQIWVAAGTYRPVVCNPCTDADRETAFRLVPDVEIYGGFAGSESALDQRDWATQLTVLSGDIGTPNDSLDNVFNVLIAENSTEKTILDGFIVEEGNADGSFGFSAGGGLLLDANPGGTANMQIRNCTFRNNYAGGGGAVAIDCVLGGESRAVIRNCTFEGNTASLGVVSTGAAIFMQGNSEAQIRPRIVSCVFRNNYCGNDGAAISATPTGQGSFLGMEVDSCRFTDNRADDRGGAIWYRMSSFGEMQVVIKNSEFRNNTSGGEGGAIFARSSFNNIANDTIINCVFSGNVANGTSTINDGKGGAIFLRGSQEGTHNHTIINCLFDQNSAASLGGAIATTSIQAQAGINHTDIINCTFFGNTTAGDGGAIHADGSEGVNTVNLRNSILWNDQADNEGAEISTDGATVNVMHTDLEGGVPNGMNDIFNNLNTDPQFKDPDNGDFHLGPCSPVIDAGANDLLPDDLIDIDGDLDLSEVIPVDLDGQERIFQEIVDLGAYEFDGSEAALTVTKNITGESCGGACDGEVSLVAAGGQAGYTYSWSNGAETPGLEDLCAGTYYVTINDASSCTLMDSVIIETGDTLSLMVSPAVSICPGAGTELSATASGGDGNFTYTWSHELGTGDKQSVSPQNTTTYSVTVSDPNGCMATDSVTVSVFETTGVEIQGTSSICPGSSTVLDAGEFTAYEWSTGETDRQIEVNAAGNYSVQVTDENGCPGMAEIAIIEADSLMPVISGNTTLCPGSSVILEGGAGFDSYLWSTDATTSSIEVNEADTYRLTVTDASGCSGSASIQISESELPNPVINGSLSFCPGSSTTLDAGLFTAYAWSTGEQSRQITVSSPGTYQVTVTNENACTASTEVEVIEADSLSTSIAGSTIFCPGSSTFLEGEPGYASYQWSTGATTSDIEVDMPGTYGLTVTDEGGCSGAAEVIVSLADSLSTTILGSSTFCPGSFSVLTGASGFAAYEWSTGSTDSSITVSEAGDYRLTVTDASGCSGSAGISVSESASLSPVINGGLLFCQGDSSVIGVGDFATYAWSTGDTSQQITVTAEGVYEVSVSDGQGCTGSSQVSVQVQDLPDLQITGQTSFCPGEATVLDAGAGFNSYEWSEGSTTQTISVNAEGVFSVTVTDEAGCKATNEVLISFDLPEMAMVAPAPGGCADTLVLMANLPPGTTGRWTSSDTSLAILDPTSGTTRLTGLAGTPATLTWTLSTQDCPDYSSDEVTIHPDQGPLATDDQAGMAATTRSVSINLIANDQLFGAGTFDLRLLSEPVIGTVVGLENGILIYAAPAGAFGTEVLTYELCVEGCPCSFATITILIEAGQIEEVEAGNTITPNGDGFNDSFVFDIIRSTPPEAIPDNELIIFNRWGDIVFQMEGYDNNWNGVNSRGEDLPEATYYYILRLNIGEGMVLRGDITIIR